MRQLSVCLGTVFFVMQFAVLSAAEPDAGGLVIPVSNVIGGTSVENNAKKNAKGGYFSLIENIDDYKYSKTHGNQLGKTAMVNDHVYWDTKAGGLQYTHVPEPDAGGGKCLWWPAPGEWAVYEVNIPAAGAYRVQYRFSSGWGPDKPVTIHMEIDGASSGPVVIKPDDPQLWMDKKYQTGGWWGHTMVTGTVPLPWTLKTGQHVLKVFVDDYPKTGQADMHGWVWIHYFKVVPAQVENSLPEKKPPPVQGKSEHHFDSRLLAGRLRKIHPISVCACPSVRSIQDNPIN